MNMKKLFSKSRIAGLAIAATLFCANTVYGHSVGQVQSTKYFDPATVNELMQKIQSGQPTLQVGDKLSYILQFTPIGNGATTGVAGYVTDYLPPGVEVVNAEFVTPSGSGNFSPTTPNLPGGIDGGWGARGQNTFTGVFATNTYDPTGRCATAGFTNKCNGRLTELHADTGIFFSNDPRTAQFPPLPTRIAQGTNGYYVNPTGGGNLNGLLGQADATTHNLWDAEQTNAFGTSALPTLTPKSSQVDLMGGTGPAPYFAGSVVAGPQTGYQLDASGEIGPWQRIAYPGSRIGDASNGPATGALGVNTAIGGFPTTLGWGLSSSNPLPSNTNAIRWAVGKLQVGQNLYARVTVRLTALPPAAGLINSFEVFGGDAGDADGGKDNAWRYHVPSVADTNSTMLAFKEIIGLCTGSTAAIAAACSPVPSSSGGAIIPAAFVKFRYRITYLNTSNTLQTDVQLSDILPFSPVKTLQVGNLYVVSGTDIRPAKVGAQTLSNNGAVAGTPRTADVAPTVLATNNVQQITNYTTIPLLATGAGGAVELDVVVDKGANGDTLSNKAKITSAQLTGGVTSIATSTITSAPSLDIKKITSTPSLSPGGTATYTMTITNVGTASATNIIVQDMLPFIGTAVDATRRFTFTVGSSTITGLTAVTPTTILTPTVAGYTSNTNQQQITWNFGAQTLAAGASFTISFNTLVGANMPATSTAYTNNVQVNYNTNLVDSLSLAAPITLVNPIQITKSIDCVYNTAGTACTGYTGNGVVPVNAKVRFKLSYANTGTTAHTNVLLCDQMTSSQSTPAFTATISTPTLAPTPSAPFTNTSAPNGPPAGALTNPAAAACGFAAGGITFNYPAIPTLAAGATGVLYYDAATNATNSSTLSNSGKIVSTESPGGSLSTVSVSARDNAKLVITKTTSTPTINVNGTASYAITVSNTGNIDATNIRILDELPFVGTVVDATRRFNFVVGSSSFSGLTSVTPTTSVAPTQSPYSTNVNQQEVLWNFGTQILAPGASFTINFQAQAGANILASSTTYPNNVVGIFSSGPDTVYTSATNTAIVVIPTNLSITKTIECVFSGAICVPYDNTGILPTNAKLRYKMHYVNTGTTTQTNVYVCDKLPTQIVSFASVTNFTSVPAIGTPVSPANALCGLTATSFSYPVIASLAAGAAGDVFYDVQTNATSSANIVNTGKLVSAQAPGGETSAVLGIAYDVAKLGVSKTTTTPAVLAGGPATYTISVTNTGNIATTSLKIRDFLPFSGTAIDATKRFNYTSTTGYTGTSLPLPTITAVVTPTLSPYSANPNQQQVTWDFGSYSLAAGATVTITFTATVGTGMPNASYGNSAFAEYTSSSGSGNNSVNNASIIATTQPVPALVFLKTVQVIQDPVNGTTNPKYIPGADALYTLTVTNTGTGPADSNTLTIFDAIPLNTELFVGNLSGGAPYGFTPGTSTLTCPFTALGNTTDCIDFSSDTLAVTDPAKTWNYTPVGPNDPNVKFIRFKLTGAMASNTTTPPNFSITVQVKVK
jgi:uncharacterized repeat protein (TIGR01451 family)